MTKEEKAKRYDEAIERARALNNGEDVDVEAGTTICEYIFSELKESEDERIIKKLIDFVKSRLAVFPECDRFIAWLEKQGEKPQGKSALEAVKEEKVDNQNCVKSTDKVEPKFHKGDWIVFNGLTLYIKGIIKGFYITISKGGITNSYDWDIDNVARLWTIEDAKDGDVLSANWRVGANFWERIIIFKKYHSKDVEGLINAPYVEGYGNTFKNGKLIPCAKVPYYSEWTDKLYPATKEQRDLLFQTMKEAGYEWDADKKELKKEEVK